MTPTPGIRKYARRRIGTSAYTWDAIREEALTVGFDGFLVKPLFASGVVEEYEHIVRRNQTDTFREKRQASLEGRRILLAVENRLDMVPKMV